MAKQRGWEQQEFTYVDGDYMSGGERYVFFCAGLIYDNIYRNYPPHWRIQYTDGGGYVHGSRVPYNWCVISYG